MNKYEDKLKKVIVDIKDTLSLLLDPPIYSEISIVDQTELSREPKYVIEYKELINKDWLSFRYEIDTRFLIDSFYELEFIYYLFLNALLDWRDDILNKKEIENAN